MQEHSTTSPLCACGCGKAVRAPQRTFLKGHQSTWRAEHGAVTRFWSQVEKGSDTACWLWTGTFDQSGYGVFALTLHGKNISQRAHRFSYQLHYGSIPEGMLVCHTCDTPACVNPAHLWLGTHTDNAHDRDHKGRQVPHYGDENGARLHPETHVRGERSPNAKLALEQVKQIRARYKRGPTANSSPKLAAEYGVSHRTILRIVTGKGWKE